MHMRGHHGVVFQESMAVSVASDFEEYKLEYEKYIYKKKQNKSKMNRNSIQFCRVETRNRHNCLGEIERLSSGVATQVGCITHCDPTRYRSSISRIIMGNASRFACLIYLFALPFLFPLQ